MSFFSNIFTKFSGLFLTAQANEDATATADLADTPLHAIATKIGATGVTAVKAAVGAAEAAGGTGDDKYTAARKALENTLKGQKESLINLAIELAVAAL